MYKMSGPFFISTCGNALHRGGNSNACVYLLPRECEHSAGVAAF